jgi:HD-GYP domain-containing protein (c-di-GMP phosphodiesterase class II)
MRDHDRHISVRPYLFHAIAATVWVLGLPFFAIFALIGLMAPDPSFVVLLLACAATAAVAIAIGVTVWKTQPESADIAFGELLIWGWLQRRHAENRLDHGAQLLGLDRSGHPTEPVRITPEHQLVVLHDLNDALEAKDPYTYGHSQRVERHTFRTAAAMGLSVGAIEELRLAAALHDVGKIRVPDRILRKPTTLSDAERSVVEDHVVVGAWMVSSVGSADVISAVRHHHERWDGRGYPDGLAGTDIPLYARMIAVADSYDAITSTRPYRVSANREHAVDILRKEAGTQFDPMIVDAFVEALPVRLPVAGAIVLFAGPAALGRKLAMWLKRFGAGHLAPAAATLGAIVTLGAFFPSPSLIPAPQVVAQEQVQPGGNVVKGRDHKDKKEVTRDRARGGVRKITVASLNEPEGDLVLSESLARPGANSGCAPNCNDNVSRRQIDDPPDLVRPSSPDGNGDDQNDDDGKGTSDDPEPQPSRDPEDDVDDEENAQADDDDPDEGSGDSGSGSGDSGDSGSSHSGGSGSDG